jgi:hypothetical protein
LLSTSKGKFVMLKNLFFLIYIYIYIYIGERSMNPCFYCWFLVHRILGIVGSQMETNLKSNNLTKLIFVNKKWQNDPKVGWEAHSNFSRIN